MTYVRTRERPCSSRSVRSHAHRVRVRACVRAHFHTPLFPAGGGVLESRGGRNSLKEVLGRQPAQRVRGSVILFWEARRGLEGTTYRDGDACMSIGHRTQRTAEAAVRSVSRRLASRAASG